MNPLLRRAGAAAFAAFVALGACNDPNAIPNASASNVIDTLTLWSLSGGPLTKPSAYSLNARNGVRTWEAGSGFEFAFDEDASGRPFFLPTDVLGLISSTALKPGLKRSTSSFDAMTKAPSNGYIVSDTVPLARFDLFYVRSTISTCSLLGVPLYGKLEVLAVDSVAPGTVTIRVVANQNCGYRGLNLGIPKH
jgi:hypothetical protein